MPVNVTGLTSGVSAIAAGSGHTCALTTAGGVKCWGYNDYGQLGDGTTTQRAHARRRERADQRRQRHRGRRLSHLRPDHRRRRQVLGSTTADGQLGDGTTTSSATPVDVSGLTSGVSAIAAGDYHTCALTTAGGVKCWGYNSDGQLGDGTTTAARHARGRERADQRRQRHRGRRLSHLRADHRRRRQVLGIQLQRSTGRWHDHAAHRRPWT